MANLEIVFITSSRIKLAHAECLAKNYNITISKQKNYGIGYIEPRIYNREQLLNDSYKDAHERFVKNVSLPEEKFFIIEDTSVIIDALSDSTNEVPGLDIKYWMKEHTFEKLDLMLKQQGKNRKCSVRSDIILHLPKKLREKYQINYMQFTGISEGFIVESEYKYSTNATYPWLDNRTFNKWFTPDGTIPLGMMNIAQSLEYDFRKKAFDKLLVFLESEKYINKTKIRKQQYELPLYFNNFILVGPTCTGKSTLAMYLADNYQYYHIEASDFMYKKFYELHGINSGFKIGDFAKQALKDNPCIISDLVIDEINRLKGLPFVISGFRDPLEIECFLKKYRGGIEVVYIDADIQIRFQRNINRKRTDDENSFENFEAKNALQQSMGLSQMHENYKDDLLLNEKSFDEFYNEFERKYTNLLPEKKTIITNDKINTLKLKLEEAILLAMYFDKNDKYHTTTELSSLVKEMLNIDKNKNNISRYFNQKFHPYYDIDSTSSIKYKLNSTGKSQARFIRANLS